MIVKTPTVVDYMLLGGGGSGGCQQNDACAGGGGAGGLISGNTIINSGSYNTVVGEGGVGKTTTGYGNNGNDSTILSLGLIAIGGGGGGYHGYDGKNGGCGGGAGSRFETGLYYNPGIGSQGKNGGTGSSAAGGGGGLTSNGGNSRYYSSVQGYGGNGGSGSSFNDIWPEISGTDLGFSFNRFGGGGGGTGYRNRHGSGVDGGTNGVYRATGINALPNTGAGSGGGHGVAKGQLPAGKSGNGGSGFVIIRFPI